jgi:hypothetical protein
MRNPTDILMSGKTVIRERGEQYGDFRVMSRRMATMMGGQINVEISPSDVMLMMAQLKLARAATDKSTDTFLDAINYVALAWACLDNDNE